MFKDAKHVSLGIQKKTGVSDHSVIGSHYDPKHTCFFFFFFFLSNVTHLKQLCSGYTS